MCVLRPSPSRPVASPWALAVVAERAIAFAHGLAPTDLLRARDEVEPFLGVAGDAVEDEPEQPTRIGLVLVSRDVVQHPLHHLQLIQRHQRDALRQRSPAASELNVSDALEDHPDVGGLRSGQLVTGEQVALRPLEAEPRDPHPGVLPVLPHAPG